MFFEWEVVRLATSLLGWELRPFRSTWPGPKEVLSHPRTIFTFSQALCTTPGQ